LFDKSEFDKKLSTMNVVTWHTADTDVHNECGHVTHSWHCCPMWMRSRDSQVTLLSTVNDDHVTSLFMLLPAIIEFIKLTHVNKFRKTNKTNAYIFGLGTKWTFLFQCLSVSLLPQIYDALPSELCTLLGRPGHHWNTNNCY